MDSKDKLITELHTQLIEKKQDINELRRRIGKTLQALNEILFYDDFSNTTHGFGNAKRELMFYLSECKTLEEFDKIYGDK